MASNCSEAMEGVWGDNQVLNGSAEQDMEHWEYSNVASVDNAPGPTGSKSFLLSADARMSQIIAPNPLVCVEDIKVKLEFLPMYPQRDSKIDTVLTVKIMYEDDTEDLLKVSCEDQVLGVW